MPRVLKLVIAYDGTTFVGWQRQTNGTSIQALVEDSLARIEGKPVTIAGAGRTDAGVHALAQVASVSVESRLDAGTIRRALNATLPGDVRILDVADAADDFHARFDARAKTYRYRIVNGESMSPFDWRYAWHVTAALDIEAMQRAAAVLVGRHDFAAFQATGSSVATSTRTVTRSEISVSDDPCASTSRQVKYEIVADGFLRHMVRAIVGTLVEIGSGRWTADTMDEVLFSRDRARAGPTAPAQGLFLVSVDYGGGRPAVLT
jgi:tRNA pseudouridine38-40 synthase